METNVETLTEQMVNKRITENRIQRLIEEYEFTTNLITSSILEYKEMNQDGLWTFMITTKEIRLAENEKFLSDLKKLIK